LSNDTVEVKVGLRNVLDEQKDIEFKKCRGKYLLWTVYSFARESDDEIYNLIVNNKIEIYVNGELTHPDDWAKIGLDEGDEIVVVPVLSGGGGGKRAGWISFIAGAIITAIGIYMMPAPYAPYVIMFGLGLMFTGASILLFKPDLPSLPSLGGDKDTQTYNWSGIRTTARADTRIPVVYGTHRVGGNIISGFVESDGEDSYLNMLIALCEGEINGICKYSDHTSVCVTSDTTNASYCAPAIYLDGQPLHNFSNVQWWYRTGTNEASPSRDEFYPFVQNKIPHFDGARVQYDDGREITTDGIVYTTSKEVDMAYIRVQAPSLYSGSGSGISEGTIEYKIEYKEENESTYNQYQFDVYSPRVTKLTGDQTDAIEVKYEGNTDRRLSSEGIPNNYVLTILHNELPTTVTPCEVRTNYNIYIELRNESTGEIHRRTITNSIEHDCRVEIIDSCVELVPFRTFYIDNRIQFDSYLITIKHTVQDGQQFRIYSELIGTDPWFNKIRGTSKTSLWDSIVLDFNNLPDGVGRGTYDIKISRRYPKSSDMYSSDNLILSSVTEIVHGNFIYPNTALLGLRIKATGQLSGAPPNVNVLVSGRKVSVPRTTGNEDFDDLWYNPSSGYWETNVGATRTWDEESFTATTQYTENSMVCVRDLLLNDRFGLGEYITTNNIYTPGMVAAIKSCHVEYDPYSGSSEDYLDWYSGGYNDLWPNNWSFTQGNGSSATTAREITADGNSLYYTLALRLNQPLVKNASYTFNVTSSLVSPNVNFYLNYSQDPFDNISVLNVAGSALNKAATTSSISFIPKVDGVRSLQLTVRSANNTSNANWKITDMSLTGTIKDHYHTMNGVLESDQSALTSVLEMCDSFRCWPVWINGKFSFVMDEDTTPTQTLTTGNIKNGTFSQQFSSLSDIPYKLIGQYTDKDYNYEMRALISRSGYSDLTKVNEKTIGLKWITDRRRAVRELRHRHNKVTNVTHSVNFKTGVDSIHSVAGDIINVYHPLPGWGESGRIIEYNSASKEITLDTSYQFNNVATDTFLLRYQIDGNTYVTATVDKSGISSGDEKSIVKVVSWVDDPLDDAVFAIGKSTTNKKFRILSAMRVADNTVEVSAIEHIASLYTEPAMSVIKDYHTELYNPSARPGPPTNVSITQLDVNEGIGFEFSVSPPTSSNYIIKDIVVQMAVDSDSGYMTLLTIDPSVRKAKYVNNNLKLDSTYYFKVFCRTDTREGEPVYTSVSLSYDMYKPPPPSGFYIKGYDKNATTFDGRDLTIAWNPVGINYQVQGEVSGYRVNVYHDSVDEDNFMREAFVSNPEFYYSMENNIADSSNNKSATPFSTLVFVANTYTSHGLESAQSKAFRVRNERPDNISGLSAQDMTYGVNFSWNKSVEQDHKNYIYRVKVGSGSFTNWTDTIDNSYLKTMTATEINTYGTNATILIQVKDVDLYGQTSATYVQASSHSIAATPGNIFNIAMSASGGSGTLASLIDGNTASSAYTI